METYNSDPKPGRLILPLVLIGMIATTYTFINRVATNNSIEIVSQDTTTTVVETAKLKRLLQQVLQQHSLKGLLTI